MQQRTGVAIVGQRRNGGDCDPACLEAEAIVLELIHASRDSCQEVERVRVLY